MSKKYTYTPRHHVKYSYSHLIEDYTPGEREAILTEFDKMWKDFHETYPRRRPDFESLIQSAVAKVIKE